MTQMQNAQSVALQLEKVRDKLPLLYERDDILLTMIQQRGDVERVSSRNMRLPLQIRPGGKAGLANMDGGDLGRGCVNLSTTPNMHGTAYWAPSQFGTLFVSGASTNSVLLTTVPTGGILPVISTLSAAHRFTPTSLGVNTTNPQYNLDVNGTAAVNALNSVQKAERMLRCKSMLAWRPRRRRRASAMRADCSAH
jgi:hypothetical protein